MVSYEEMQARTSHLDSLSMSRVCLKQTFPSAMMVFSSVRCKVKKKPRCKVAHMSPGPLGPGAKQGQTAKLVPLTIQVGLKYWLHDSTSSRSVLLVCSLLWSGEMAMACFQTSHLKQ